MQQIPFLEAFCYLIIIFDHSNLYLPCRLHVTAIRICQENRNLYHGWFLVSFSILDNRSFSAPISYERIYDTWTYYICIASWARWMYENKCYVLKMLWECRYIYFTWMFLLTFHVPAALDLVSSGQGKERSTNHGIIYAKHKISEMFMIYQYNMLSIYVCFHPYIHMEVRYATS